MNITKRYFGIQSKCTLGPADSILNIFENFKKDKDPRRISLAVGAQRDNNGNPWILPSVQKAVNIIESDPERDLEQLPITGLNSFTSKSIELAYGKECKAIKENRVAQSQTISGTGGLRVVFEFLKNHGPNKKDTIIWTSSPTWGNHNPIINEAGLNYKTYRYQNDKNINADINVMLEDLEKAKKNDCVLLQTCAHNPTGCDLNMKEWKKLEELISRKELIPLFDTAYQGFASGDLEKDSEPIRLFLRKGHQSIVIQSYSKNMGLYGHRTGCISVVCKDLQEKERVLSNFKLAIRPMQSNPPIQGAMIASTILNNDQLINIWKKELKVMSGRINEMRTLLIQNLINEGSNKNWDHIINQIGMFAYTGLNEEQVQLLADKHHIYLTLDGRISVSGLNTNNISYVAKCINEVSQHN